MTKQITSLAALKAAGAAALLGGQPKSADVKWTNDAGEEFTFTVLIQPMSFGTALDFDPSTDRKAAAQAISSLVLLDDGEGGHEQLSYDEALALHPRLGWALFSAISAGYATKK